MMEGIEQTLNLEKPVHIYPSCHWWAVPQLAWNVSAVMDGVVMALDSIVYDG